MEHAPTPWEVWNRFNIRAGDHRSLVPGGSSQEMEANAAFIVKACNNFDKLIVLLNNILEEPFHEGLEAEIKALLGEVEK